MVRTSGNLKNKNAAIDVLSTGPCSLRKAEIQGSGLLWKWSQTPDAKANSYTFDLVSLEDRRQWLEDRLNSPDSIIWILDAGGIAAGRVRYDRISGDEASISFPVDSNFRSTL
jgi:hypothetical protein